MEKVKNNSQLSIAEHLSTAMANYVDNDFSFALWRLPDSNLVHLAGSGNPQRLSEVILEESKPGFLFAPFQPDQSKIFLPADELTTFESGRIVSAVGAHAEELQNAGNSVTRKKKAAFHFAPPVTQNTTDQKHYQLLVTRCKEEVNLGRFEKIVPSRTKTISLPDQFDPVSAFEHACQQYPHAMVSLFSSPLTGTWMGATPEMLVSVSKDLRFRTVAVAGTQPFEAGLDPRSVMWTQKDIEEQALVERYIISCFKKIRLREFDEHGPKTVIAGNVLHLRTDFEVDMAATNFPQLGTVMLKLLHPTSAVCGMPLEGSIEFLKNNEGYDRKFYSGYLGPVNIQQESQLYVNLRCMQLYDKEAVLYAGAGILADSDPVKEWMETEMKMNTLDRIIRQ